MIQLKISLEGIEPEVWRRIQLNHNITYDMLHKIIQIVFGWSGIHFYKFIRGNEIISVPNKGMKCIDARKHKLDLNDGELVEYCYDFGYKWLFSIVVEASNKENIKPVCIAGENSSPPEESGGVEGYAELKAADPDTPGISFVIDKVNQALLTL